MKNNSYRILKLKSGEELITRIAGIKKNQNKYHFLLDNIQILCYTLCAQEKKNI